MMNNLIKELIEDVGQGLYAISVGIVLLTFTGVSAMGMITVMSWVEAILSDNSLCQ